LEKVGELTKNEEVKVIEAHTPLGGGVILV
jgi:hypothetical protein